MFDKRDCRMYKKIKRDEIYPKICDFWSRQGFYVAQLSPFEIQGQSFYQKIGLHREFYMRLDEQKGNTYIDLQFRAKISDEGMVGGVAAAVIAWPIALVGGALSYDKYETEATNLMYSFWQFIDEETKQTGSIPPGWTPPPSGGLFSTAPPPPPPPQSTPPGSAPQDTKPCDGCGALLPKNWKACPYCGKGKE